MYLRPTGAFICEDPTFAGQRVTDTFRCNHCGGVVAISRESDISSYDRCAQCDALICARCCGILHNTLVCDVFWNKLKRAEDRARLAAE